MSKVKRFAPAFVLALATSALSVSQVLALAQQGQTDRYGSRKPACGCYCGGTTPDYVLFGDEDCAGILAADVCGGNLASLPPEERADVCQKVKAQRKLDSCPVFAPYCEPESEAGAEPEAEKAPGLPPNSDRDGLADGFGGPPPASPTGPTGGLSPPRLVYLVAGAPAGGKPGTAFTVFLDRAACLLPLDTNNQPSAPAAAKHVVRGRIVRGEGRVRIEAEASELTGATKRGPYTGEAEGEDAAAVTLATRTMLEQMDLVCRR